jgi:hypothetical protein
MSTIGSRITSFAIAGVLCLGLSRKGVAQMADTATAVSDTVDAVRIETITVTAYRVRQPAKVPIAKAETRGKAPSKGAVWVPGFWNLQADRNTAPRAGWVWVPGRWLTPPARHAHWFPAHWGWSDDWWSWIPGHWTQGENWIPAPIDQGE